MSTTVDQRVVEMRFDNSNFERNVSSTMSTLDKLKRSLRLDGAAKGLENVSTAADGVNLSPLGNAVEAVKAKFSAMDVVAITALTNITNKAINAGESLIKSLSIDQITAGWQKFGDKTTSVSTLVAQGNALEDVNAQLDRLNWFTDETSYNFTDMVSNIAKFTATGKGLEESVTAMEGIANWAALSGQNAATASRAMYQLSQAMGSGVMRKEDYKSIQNASMDTEEFRQKCLDAGVAMGTLKDNGDGTYASLVEGAKSSNFTISQFADHLTQDMWLTSDVMMSVFTDYSSAVNAIYEVTEEKGMLASEVLDEVHTKAAEINDGTMSDTEAINAAIKELGYTAEDGSLLFDAFGIKAFEAAQKARTWGDAVDSVKDAVSTGWMNTFEIIFGNAEEATALWTDLANAMWDVFAAGGEARNEMLKGWKELGGRDDLIESFWNVWEGIGSIVAPVKEAFRDIFPATTSEQLANFTAKLKELTSKLKVSDETADRIKRTFKGFFSILDIGKKAISAILKPIGQLFGSDGFGSLGDFLLETAADIGDFFTTLNEGFETGGISGVLSTIATGISNFLTKVFGNIGSLSDVFTSAGNTICKVASKIWSAVTKVFGWIKENVSAGDIFAGLAGGGIFAVAKKLTGFIDKIKEAFEGLFDKKSNGIVTKFKDILGSVNESLQAFTSGIKVASLVAVAAAIAILSSAMKKISELDGAGIAKSLAAIGVSLAMMMKALNSMPKNSAFATSFFGMSESTNLVKSGISMVLMAESIKLLADAITDLSKLSLKEIAKGLIAVGGGMTVLSLGLKAINRVKIPLSTSVAVLALAESCKILGDALGKFSAFSWDEIAHGLVAMGGALGELVAAMAILGKTSGLSSIFGSAGILIMVQDLGDLADALEQFGEMQWDEIGRGLSAMGGALAELAIVLGVLSKISKISIGGSAGGGIVGVFSNKLFGKGGASLSGSGSFSAQLSGLSNIFSAGAIWIAIQGLSKLADSLKSFAEMQWDEIGRGLAAMGGALLEVGAVTGALGYLTGFAGIIGAGTMLLAVQSLDELVSAFKSIGEMPWDEIDRGVVGLGDALLEVGAVTGALGYLTGFAGLVGAGTILLAVQGLDDLANGLKKFGEMQWDEIGRGLSAMGGALAEIAVGGLLNSLSSLGALSISTIAKPLGTLADSVKKWVDVKVPTGLGLQLMGLALAIELFTFGGFGAATLAIAAEPLGIMADSVKKWSSVTVPSGLKDNLTDLANGIKAFSWAFMGGWSMSAVDGPLGSLADSVQKWSGVTVPANMKTNLTSLANGIKAFSWAFMGGWSMSAVDGPLASLAKGVKAWNGVAVPDGLKDNLVDLADGVKAFSWAFLGGWSMDAIDGPLKSLATAVKAWNGVTVPSGLKDNLTDLADGVKAFSWAFLGGWSMDAIDGPLASLAEGVKAWDGVTVPTGMEESLTGLANGVKAFKFKSSGASTISEVAEPLGTLAESIKKWSDVTVPDGLGSQLESLAKGVKAFKFKSSGAGTISEIAEPMGILAESIKNWAGVTVPENLGDQLKTLAEGVKKFQFKGSGASAISTVAEPLGAMADSVKKWSGVTVPEGLGDKLKSFAEGVKAFNFNGSAKSILSEIAEPLGTLADSIRNWSDVTVPAGLGTQLESLGKGIEAFSFEGANNNALVSSAPAIGTLATSIKKWSGVSVPDNLGTQLESLGKGIEAFSFEGADNNALVSSAPAIGTLADSIKKWSGVSVPGNLGTQLENLAAGIGAFSFEGAGDSASTLTTVAPSIGTMADSISKWSGVSVPDNLGTQLESLGKGIEAFSFEGANNNALVSSAPAIGTLATSIKKWSGVSVPDNLGTQLESLGKGIEAFSFEGADNNALVSSAPAIGTLADSIKKWSGVSVPGNLGTQLTSLAKGVEAFSFDGADTNTLATSATGIGSMADSIRKWSGVTIPETLGEQLTSLSKGVESFIFDGETSLGNAATGIGSMADSIRKWSTLTIPETLGSQLESLAKGVGAFIFDGTISLDTSATGIGSMADSIRKWSGVTIPETLGSQLKSLAVGVEAFIFDGETSLGNAATGIGSMADSIRKWSTLTIPETLGSQLKSLASSLKTFNGITGVDAAVTGMNNIHGAASKLVGINFNKIKSGFSTLADSLNGLSSIDTSSISTIGSDIVNGLITPLANASEQFSSIGTQIAASISAGITSGQSNVTAAMRTLVTSLTTAIKSKNSTFKSAGKALATSLASGIRSGSSSASSAGSSIASSGVSGARANYSGMYNAGKYLGAGLVAGINAKKTDVYNAAYALGQKAVEGEKAGQASASPSKLTIKAGKWLGEGLIIGMERMGRSVYNAGENMGQSAVNATRSAMTTVLDALNSDMDAQPTIRPVVDLSDVQTGAAAVSGMFNGIQTVGVHSNLSTISATMNSKLQNGTNDDIISAINKLGDGLENVRGDTYNFGDFTYDDGSNVADAVGTLIRYARIGRRV